jgi:hypothetical protein
MGLRDSMDILRKKKLSEVSISAVNAAAGCVSLVAKARKGRCCVM